MINKEKLLKEIKLKSDDVDVTWVCSFIKNFPEEPEQPIDFDALYKEWSATPCKLCNCLSQLCKKQLCFKEFLKSKNLTAPKSFEIPVKRTWKLKKKYVNYFELKGVDSTQFDNYTKEPECVDLYDLHEQPDYSKIPKGSIVELKHGFIRRFLYPLNDKLFMKMDCESCTTDEEFSNIIRIVEPAKE